MMTTIHSCILLFFLITTLSATNQTSNDCDEKEKPMALFDIAKNVLEKVKIHIPNCEEKGNLTHPNNSQCGEKEKTAAFIDGILGLIEDAREKFPACKSHNISNPNEDLKDKPTEEPDEKPTEKPDEEQTKKPNEKPTEKPDEKPTEIPDEKPTEKPDEKPKETPTGMDCLEIRQKGLNKSGAYTIHLNMTNAQNKNLDVYCDMDTDGGGWTVIQRRDKFEIQEDFYRDWIDYKNGFGNITRDFWIGNDVIHFLSNQGRTSIRFDMKDRNDEQKYALYEDFQVENETNLYKLHIGSYRGNAGNAMEDHNRMPFSTKDKKNNPGGSYCAKDYKGGWWYKDCYKCNPNGLFQPNQDNSNQIVNWLPWKQYQGLAFFEIKIRRQMH